MWWSLLIFGAQRSQLKGAHGLALQSMGGPNRCLDTAYTVTIDKHSKEYFLPASGSGERLTMDCHIGPYINGRVSFRCDDGHWAMDENCEDPDLQCKETVFTLHLPGGSKLVFQLPDIKSPFRRRVDVGPLPCPSGVRNAKGDARFVCKEDGQWKLDEETCSKRPGDCAATSFTMTIDKYKATYSLPVGGDSESAERDCERRKGTITFHCADGIWQHVKNNCGK